MRFLRLVFALAVLSVAVAATAQTATSTTLGISSGGSAVTTVREETEVTLTATVVAGGSPVTRGQVNFCEVGPAPLKCTDIRLLGTVQLTAAGTAVLAYYPAFGTHTYQAEFIGTNSAAASSASATLTVNAYSPTITQITYPGQVAAGTYSFDVSVTGSDGATVPTGSVSVLDTSNAGYVLVTAPLVPGSVIGTGSTPTGFAPPIVDATAPKPVNSFVLAAADFNGDGKADVAVGINPVPTTLPQLPAASPISVLLGNGSGALSPASSSTAGVFPVAMAVADFNGDGKADMVVTNYGNFDLPIPTPPAPVRPLSPIYYVYLPIFWSRTSPGSVMILPGNGDGTFSSAITLPAAQAPAPTFAAVGDFNHDGIPDLAVANSTTSSGTVMNDVTILLGNGDGTFTQKSTVVAGNLPSSIVVGDFNNDGKQDLAIANANDNTVSIALGNGDGTFGTATAIPSTTGLSIDPVALVAADFNGDGNLDIAVINYGDPGLYGPFSNYAFRFTGSILVLLGNGNGTFSPMPEVPGNYNLNTAAVGDFNGDGKPDLAVTDNNGLVDVLLGKGDGSFSPGTYVSSDGGSYAVAAADFNGDGIADLTSAGSTIAAPPYPPIPANGPYPFFPPSGVYYLNMLLAEVGSTSGTATATATAGPFYVVGTGFHDLIASYNGDNNYAGSSSGPEAVTAEPEPTTLSLSASPASINYGQSVTLIAVVAPITAQNHSATGTVTFSLGTTVLGTTPLTGGVAVFTTTMLPSGVDTVTATYSGDTNFGVSTNTTAETVNGSQSVTVLTIAPNPALVGQTVTLAASVTGVSFPQTPTGSVTFYSGTTALAQVPLGAGGVAMYSSSGFAFGNYAITAVYSGDAAFYPSTSTPTTLVISGYLSATTLTAAPNPAGTGQAVTLSAGVTGIGSSSIATGTIKFSDGAAVLGTGTLDATGHATFTTATLSLGTHSLTAAYGGSSSYSASTSAAYSEVIESPAFTISLASPSITLAKYQHTTTSVALASSGSFADNIALSCTNPPANLTCIFTPASAALAANSSTSISFYLDTDSILGGDFTGPLTSAKTAPTSIHLALLLSPLLLFAVRGRRPRITLMLLFVAGLSFALGGCGSSVITPVPGTLPGTYSVTITGTGAATGVTHTANLTLIVTQ